MDHFESFPSCDIIPTSALRSMCNGPHDTDANQEVEEVVCAHPPQTDQDPVGLSPGSLFIRSQQVLHHGHPSENTKHFTSLRSTRHSVGCFGNRILRSAPVRVPSFLNFKHYRHLVRWRLCVTSCLCRVVIGERKYLRCDPLRLMRWITPIRKSSTVQILTAPLGSAPLP